MNKLFVVLLLGFCGGVVARSFFDFGWSFAVFFVLLGLISAGIFIFLQPKADRPRAEKLQNPIFLIGLFFLAFGSGILRYEIKESRNDDFENKIGSKIIIQGAIIEEPEEKENYTRLIMEENKTKNKILLVSRRYPEFHYGDKVEINGVLNKPEDFDPVRSRTQTQASATSNGIDWPAYLAKEDIYYEVFYPNIKITGSGGGFWLKRWLFGIKEKFIANLSALLPEPHAGYLAGLTIGGKKSISKDLQDEFRRTGVIHIVVLSGYNVTIVAYAIMGILSFLPQIFGMSLGILGILLFALMAGASATVVRASIMAVLVLLAKSTGRIYQITTALLAAGFLMILHNPKILRFDTSFQLSFLATLALIYVSPIFEKKLSFVPKKFQLREISSATISTQIFVLPFLLYQMGLFSAVALPVNLLILIFVPVTMLFGFLSGGLGFISHFLAIPFGWIAYALSSYELWIVNLFSKLPFAAFNISISFCLMLLIYIIYAIVIFKNKKLL
jgi:competence protein ComEC